jgi:DNA modification methylase
MTETLGRKVAMREFVGRNDAAGRAAGRDTGRLQIRDRIKELRRVKASELLPNPKNWRRHPPAQADAMLGLLIEIGCADALLARELPDGRLMLIDGHLRADIMPHVEVPVLIVDLNDEEADKLLLTLDPLATLAQADSERIAELLSTVSSEDESVRALLGMISEQYTAGIGERGEVIDLEPRIDKAAELMAKWGTRAGQLWQAGPHRLLCADCRELTEISRLWTDGARFRVLWTDPPYGVNYAAKNELLNRTDRGNRIQKPIANDALAPAAVFQLFELALRQAKTFAAAGAVCYARVPSGALLVGFLSAFENSGFSFKHQLVWVKNHFVLGMSDYQHRHEPILYGWLENGAHYFTDDRTKSSVFEIDRPQVSDSHPCTKPVQLISEMISNSSRMGEIVFDPFCGSGSTLVAAHQLRRVGRAVEIDPGYVAVALERLVQLGLKPEVVKEA